MKRIVLFLLTNLAVLVVLSIVLRLFGLDRVAYQATGLDYGSLLAFSAVVGIVFGVAPARKASHLNPISALRFE